MKFISILFFAVVISSPLVADGTQIKNSALQVYRDYVPSSRGLNKAVAHVAGVPSTKVQDLLNTYVLVGSQWLLYQALLKTNIVDANYREHIAGFLTIHHLLYLGLVTYNYVEEGIRESHTGQALAFGVNAVSAFFFAKWWRTHYEYAR